MRLIDADELPVEETVRIYLNGLQEHFSLFSYKKSDIDEAPTVEAIPIEWIKKWLTNIENDVRYDSELVKINGEVKAINYKGKQIRLPCITDILEDWEKENGRSE